MTHEQWSRTLQSKVSTSWNLHQLLPDDLDFFILLSSVVGVYGFPGQSNYAAGGSFQDALARQRNTAAAAGPHHRRQGVSVSLDLGWMRDDGAIRESEQYRRRRAAANDINPVSTADLLAVLEHYCDPSLPPPPPLLASGSPDQSQLLVGAATPAEVRARGGDLSWAMRTRLFAGFDVDVARAAGGSNNSATAPGEGVEKSAAQLFRQADGATERTAVVIEALRGKLARALAVEVDEIDGGKSLTDYGVDSLMAVELRNWIRRDFGANLAVFDIMNGGKTIRDIGDTVYCAVE